MNDIIVQSFYINKFVLWRKTFLAVLTLPKNNRKTFKPSTNYTILKRKIMFLPTIALEQKVLSRWVKGIILKLGIKTREKRKGHNWINTRTTINLYRNRKLITPNCSHFPSKKCYLESKTVHILVNTSQNTLLNLLVQFKSWPSKIQVFAMLYKNARMKKSRWQKSLDLKSKPKLPKWITLIWKSKR